MATVPRSLFPLAILALSGAGVAACKSDPSPQRAENAPAATSSGESSDDNDDDATGATNERGNEGDDDAIPMTPAPPPHGPGSAALLAELNRILLATRTSSYSHKTHVDENAGTYDIDCSGLVDYALLRVAPDALETLRNASGVKRPLAKHFVTLLEALAPNGKRDRWRRIGSARDLAAGDIVAWKKPADVVSKNTGHIMIVRGPVFPGPNGDIAVPIIDSTAMRHGATDSRYASKATGIGTGTIYLTVDDAGAPTGYRWSLGKKARLHATAIALGRIE